MITIEWLAGFAEGEGCWTVHQHYNHTSKNGQRVYYKQMMLTFSIGQKERQVLDLIPPLLEAHGVHSKVYPKAQHYAYELRVVGCANVHKLTELVLPYMHSQKKIVQAVSCLAKCKGVKCGGNHWSIERREAFSLAGVVDPTTYDK